MNPNKLKNGFELAYLKNFNHLVNLYKTRFFDVCTCLSLQKMETTLRNCSLNYQESATSDGKNRDSKIIICGKFSVPELCVSYAIQ